MNFIRNKERSIELLCHIITATSQWMLENLLTDEKETWIDRNTALQMPRILWTERVSKDEDLEKMQTEITHLTPGRTFWPHNGGLEN